MPQLLILTSAMFLSFATIGREKLDLVESITSVATISENAEDTKNVEYTAEVVNALNSSSNVEMEIAKMETIDDAKTLLAKITVICNVDVATSIIAKIAEMKNLDFAQVLSSIYEVLNKIDIQQLSGKEIALIMETTYNQMLKFENAISSSYNGYTLMDVIAKSNNSNDIVELRELYKTFVTLVKNESANYAKNVALSEIAKMETIDDANRIAVKIPVEDSSVIEVFIIKISTIESPNAKSAVIAVYNILNRVETHDKSYAEILKVMEATYKWMVKANLVVQSKLSPKEILDMTNWYDMTEFVDEGSAMWAVMVRARYLQSQGKDISELYSIFVQMVNQMSSER